MAKVVVDLGNVERFQRQFDALLTRDQQAVTKEAAQRVGVAFDGYTRSQLPPPVRTLTQAQGWTEKQKRWWWGTMHRKAQGKSQELPGWTAAYQMVDGRKTLVLSGSYRRTGTLVKSLFYEVRQTARETDVIYGTNIPYAKWVIDRTDQATYHKGNWKTLQAMAESFAPDARRIFETVAYRETMRILRGL